MNWKITNAALAIGIAASGLSFHAFANAEGKIVGTISINGTQQQDFPKLAKISLIQAIKIANELVPGEILSTGLERENGFLVYAVEITGKKTGFHEVIVDAGNGKVLADELKHGITDHDDEEDDRDDD